MPEVQKGVPEAREIREVGPEKQVARIAEGMQAIRNYDLKCEKAWEKSGLTKVFGADSFARFIDDKKFVVVNQEKGRDLEFLGSIFRTEYEHGYTVGMDFDRRDFGDPEYKKFEKGELREIPRPPSARNMFMLTKVGVGTEFADHVQKSDYFTLEVLNFGNSDKKSLDGSFRITVKFEIHEGKVQIIEAEKRLVLSPGENGEYRTRSIKLEPADALKQFEEFLPIIEERIKKIGIAGRASFGGEVTDLLIEKK